MGSLSQISDIPRAARKALSGKGAKLHAHEAHVRRTKNGGYVIRHDLRDKNGNPPTDGQRDSAEYHAASEAEMLANMQQHMGAGTGPGGGAQPGDDEEDEEQPAAGGAA